ncbi:T9SS type A sorting domain-containing protein [candidate division WOR-3 bacterium]|nr:T9SS type A sorting domain-containing protein [candidate division WOR-3 bacterium]
MMKTIYILTIILSISLLMTDNIYAKSREVYLLPTKPGEPSKIATAEKDWVWWLIQYDSWSGYLSGLLAGDTVGIYFEPPAACSLVEVHFCKYRYEDGDAPTYWGLVADVPDGVTLNSYEEYHNSASMPGPTPVGTIFARAEFAFPFTEDWQWDTLSVPGTPDVGKDAFWAGTVIGDSSHTSRIDPGVSPPYHAICYKQGGAAPVANGPGWYSSWHLFWVRALVKVYENIGPVIEAEELQGTYNTSDRRVDIYTEDFDPDISTLGIDNIMLYYILNDTYDTLDVNVIQDSVMFPAPWWEYAMWHAMIPGQSPETKVTYWVEGSDGVGAVDITPEYWYRVKAGTPGNALLFIESNENWGSGLHDAFLGLPWDFWYERTDGIADNTVTDFYVTGDGARAVSWLAFAGANFAMEPYGWSWTQPFRDFMDNGGCLFLAGQDIPGGGYGLGYGEWIAPPSPHPLRDYLKAYEGIDDYILESPFTVTIENTDILTTGMPSEVTVDCNLVEQITWTGIFTELDDECVPLFSDEEGNILGYRYEDVTNGFKVVFMYFPFHAITDTNAQDTLIYNLTSWFELGVEETSQELAYNLPVITPNPISKSATLNFSVPRNEHVSIRIYDVTGSLISILTNERFNAGKHTLTINTDELVSGVYFLKMVVGKYSSVRKFLVLK